MLGHLITGGIFLTLTLPATVLAQAAGNTYINPPSLTKATGYTHVVVAADRRTVYIAGQVAFDSTGALVGAGDFKAQAEQVFGNLRRALASVGASFTDVVRPPPSSPTPSRCRRSATFGPAIWIRSTLLPTPSWLCPPWPGPIC